MPDVEPLVLAWFKKESGRLALSELMDSRWNDLEDVDGAIDHFEALCKWSLRKNDFTLIRSHAEAVLREANLISDPASLEYRLLAQTLLRGMLENIQQQKKRRTGDFAGVKVDPLFSKSPASQPAEGISLKELIDRYQKDRGARWTKKTKDGYTLVFRALKELLGEDRGAKTITREDCRKVKDILMDLAPNYTKLPATRGKTMMEAAKVSRELDMPRRRAESVNSYLVNLAALFNYAVEEAFVDRHPAKNLLVPVVRKKKDRKKPFDIDQLNAIFKAPLYTGCVNDENGYATSGPAKPRRGRFWVPLLSLFTGMRLNECCQLHVADVRYMGKVPVIIITEDSEPGADAGDIKRVKTEAGERYVPIHPELEKLGFLTYWKEMKERGENRLFPDLTLGANGYYSDPFQKWFGRFLKKTGAAKPKTSFHSFRHTYRDALREANISQERVKALGGWANRETQEDYGDGLKPATLYAEIKKVKFKGLRLAHLYAV